MLSISMLFLLLSSIALYEYTTAFISLPVDKLSSFQFFFQTKIVFFSLVVVVSLKSAVFEKSDCI